MVSWSSWLWHLLNTQNVPSSILGEIKSYLFFALAALPATHVCHLDV
ncbi:unnamed protein product [Kuraishia capsulata CBS 1993]|uniref:Uncharacterized protein n=1 Tax=Kuraishia capsulata CBS 1993 TaxID=1382522 RepID=W6MSV1_9ASCO|nr:uncharacterized protein KUCA_T00005895001 [Kuraishia capsulata CBS 1993]CDK29901.1 unnamed protein product [Kuraishia capsulata CBS 1993]